MATSTRWYLPLQHSPTKGGGQSECAAKVIASYYSASRLAALENFFSTRSRFNFDK